MSTSTSNGLRAVFARPDGTILDAPHFGAAADGGRIAPADARDYIALPAGSLLLMLPGRSALAYARGSAVRIGERDRTDASAVAAALPPGYTRTLLPAYETTDGAPQLPLYGYAAVAWRDGFRVAAARTDESPSWMPASHDEAAVRAGVARALAQFGGSNLIEQLARCATEYGCYTAQNVFLQQGEAAIVVSPSCNAQCIGCISEQTPDTGVTAAQPRIRTAPTPEEIADVAVAHLTSAPDAIVSFGQGCEGEPLLAAPRIAEAIRAIRARTAGGILHCNTNASRPRALTELIDAGLQSIRVSLNSVRPATYAAYYRPRGYDFSDVCESIRIAGQRKVEISLNLLTHPGVTDDPAEIEAFEKLLRRYEISMVQTRTLNIDPTQYFAAVGRPTAQPVGMRRWLDWMKTTFPQIRIGNFTRGFG